MDMQACPLGSLLAGIKRAGINAAHAGMAATCRAYCARKKLPHKETAFYVLCYLFDDVSVQSCKDVIYIAFSMDVEVDWLGKIQAEDSHD